MPSSSDFVPAGMFQTTQWTQVAAGASGSSAIKARLFAPAGAPAKESGGDTSAQSQVYFGGMRSPWANAGLLISMAAPPPMRTERREPISAPADRMPDHTHTARAAHPEAREDSWCRLAAPCR